MVSDIRPINGDRGLRGAALRDFEADLEIDLRAALASGSISAVADLAQRMAALPRLGLLKVKSLIREKMPQFPIKELDQAIREARGMRPEDLDEATASEAPLEVPKERYTLPSDSAEKLHPNDIGRLIMRDHLLMVDAGGTIYRYQGQFWERITERAIRTYAMAYDSHQFTKNARRSEVLSYVTDSALHTSITWRSLAATEVPCLNGVVDVHTGDVREHRPDDYLETVIPYDYSPISQCPIWLRCLDRWFRGEPDAPQKIAALQEFFGYILLPHARYKKALFIYGESDTGKSQIPLVITLLVGQRNICALSTEQMADERKRAPIMGKMVNLLTELPADAMIQDGGFKQLVSTGDPITIDPKFKEPFEYAPFCKHVICTNNLPIINDLSRGTFNRLLLLQFNQVLGAEEQDKDLIDKLRAEMPGILAWAVAGADRLVRQNGEFCRIEESVQALKEYREDSNSVNEFIQEFCEPDEDSYIPMSEFRDRFNRWAGRQYGPKAVSSMLKSAGAKVAQVMQSRQRFRTVKGLRWADRL